MSESTLDSREAWITRYMCVHKARGNCNTRTIVMLVLLIGMSSAEYNAVESRYKRKEPVVQSRFLRYFEIGVNIFSSHILQR